MKLSKKQIKDHEYCLEFLKQDVLSFQEKLFVYENYIPAYSENIGKIGAFFTPGEMAQDLSIEVGGRKIIDLCAGIGLLGFTYYHNNNRPDKEIEVTCVENCEEFFRVGKKLFPEATWIHGSVLDYELIRSLGVFDFAISNPPFGNIKHSADASWLKYKGNEFEYKVAEIAKGLAFRSALILPQESAPFRYSGEVQYRTEKSEKYKKFEKETGIEMEFNCGIDLSQYKDKWIGTKQLCEIVLID